MLWKTIFLDNANPRKPYGQKVGELYRTLKKIHYHRLGAGTFSPAKTRDFLPGGDTQALCRRGHLHFCDPCLLFYMLLILDQILPSKYLPQGLFTIGFPLKIV